MRVFTCIVFLVVCLCVVLAVSNAPEETRPQVIAGGFVVTGLAGVVAIATGLSNARDMKEHLANPHGSRLAREGSWSDFFAKVIALAITLVVTVAVFVAILKGPSS